MAREHNPAAVRQRLAVQYNPESTGTTPDHGETRLTLVADGDELDVVLVQDVRGDAATLCEVCEVWVTTYITEEDPGTFGGIATCLPCTVTAPHFEGLRPRR